MPAFKSMELERFLEHSGVLSDVSLFARLINLASRWDEQSNKYHDPVAGAIFGVAAVHDALKMAHLEGFREWLLLRLAQQCEDFRQYAASGSLPFHRVVELWSRPGALESIIPAAALPIERNLFLTDLRTVFVAESQPVDVEYPAVVPSLRPVIGC